MSDVKKVQGHTGAFYGFEDTVARESIQTIQESVSQNTSRIAEAEDSIETLETTVNNLSVASVEDETLILS